MEAAAPAAFALSFYFLFSVVFEAILVFQVLALSAGSTVSGRLKAAVSSSLLLSEMIVVVKSVEKVVDVFSSQWLLVTTHRLSKQHESAWPTRLLYLKLG